MPKKSNVKQRFGFEDNRPKCIVQKRLKEIDITSFAYHNINFRENKTGLPDILKPGIGNQTDYVTKDAINSNNSDKPTQLISHAYARGTNKNTAPGQCLPHGAIHVMQQKQGGVNPTAQMKENDNVNDDKGNLGSLLDL